ncbi:hypothetical protein H6G74_12145 [Nostoc spongiaeforme FACHB-130]|uniref:Transmembrane protein n=1 Tax=Nostoc spongiaeforme FACHB-130 TaxID=1357510 RepID=A0ABR8FXW4_9NOSO|nr:hypothetical protein [Nostoc spongiaeforme]MBD2595078.1 hypothetical protein [Nostoc spongiaeforme FACHB-130]
MVVERRRWRSLYRKSHWHNVHLVGYEVVKVLLVVICPLLFVICISLMTND